MYKRREYELIRSRLLEPRHLMQLVLGPRHVGKTTTVRQVLADLGKPFLYFSADDDRGSGADWLSRCWDTARIEATRTADQELILVIDEVQKIPNWVEVVKKEWDSDTCHDRKLKVLLIGSSQARYRSDLTESPAGRFEEIRMTHWSYAEMREAFGMGLDEYVWFGDYPGAALHLPDEEDWRSAVRDAAVDSVLQRDILEDNRIANVSLLKRTLELGIERSGSVLSLTRFLAELQDGGNVATVAGYLEKLHQSGLLGTLPKYSADVVRRRASIPKFQVHNNALFAALSGRTFAEARRDPVFWDRCVISAVGAHLMTESVRKGFELSYWKDGRYEVDFVLRLRGKLLALQVQSGYAKNTRGLDKFCERFSPSRSLVVGSGGLSLETFFSMDPEDLFP